MILSQPKKPLMLPKKHLTQLLQIQFLLVNREQMILKFLMPSKLMTQLKRLIKTTKIRLATSKNHLSTTLKRKKRKEKRRNRLRNVDLVSSMKLILQESHKFLKTLLISSMLSLKVTSIHSPSPNRLHSQRTSS
jgi:hypothetical protein